MRGALENEIWSAPAGFVGRYEVSNKGGVRSLLSARGRHWKGGPLLMKPKPHPGGYARVALCQKDFYIHRLVAETFIGPCPAGFQCAHLDGDPSNNSVDNLQWVSAKENQSHRAMHGTQLTHDKHPSAKLTLEKVNAIRGISGQPQSAIAKIFGVSQSCISLIVSGKNWRSN